MPPEGELSFERQKPSRFQDVWKLNVIKNDKYRTRGRFQRIRDIRKHRTQCRTVKWIEHEKYVLIVPDPVFGRVLLNDLETRSRRHGFLVAIAVLTCYLTQLTRDFNTTRGMKPKFGCDDQHPCLAAAEIDQYPLFWKAIDQLSQ